MGLKLPRRTFILGSATLVCLNSTASAQTLRFEDNTDFNVLRVIIYNDRHQPTIAESENGAYSINLTEYEPGEEIVIDLEFFVPNPKGSEVAFLRDINKLSHTFVIVVPNDSETEIAVPVFYPTKADRAEFRSLERANGGIPRNAFSKYFRAALLSEYFRERLNGTSTRDYRKSVRLWLEAAEEISVFGRSWFRVPTSIVEHSEIVYGVGSKRHLDVITRVKRINSSHIKK